MSRLIAGLLATLLLAACGGEPAPEAPAPTPAPTVEQAAAPAAPTAAPAAAAAQTVPAEDGESVDEAAAQVSPIAAAVAANTPAPAALAAFKWQEGVHFAPLASPQPTSAPPGEVEVVEIFWYGCGHCFALEPRIEAWDKKGRPSFVKLTRLPVVWNEVTREDARLYYTLEVLGKVDALHTAVFRELHVNKNPLTVIAGSQVDRAATQKKTREFLLRNGISGEDFDKTYRSFAIESKLQTAQSLARRYQADHTPMMIVNGRFSTDVTMAGGPEPLFQVVNDLAARERGSR